ncbi:hypothetical protein U8C40_06715 [Sinorhizobium medicae]|nr:hypothetical protein U8C40_06715 [Sinorhizobium medicae]
MPNKSAVAMPVFDSVVKLSAIAFDRESEPVAEINHEVYAEPGD